MQLHCETFKSNVLPRFTSGLSAIVWLTCGGVSFFGVQKTFRVEQYDAVVKKDRSMCAKGRIR